MIANDSEFWSAREVEQRALDEERAALEHRMRRAAARSTDDHDAWHRLFGNDCRRVDCDKRR